MMIALIRIGILAVALGAAGVFAITEGQVTGTLVGTATAVDGDTLRVGPVGVRLWGIDAPETAQTCLDAVGASYACGAASAWWRARARTPTAMAGSSLCAAIPREILAREWLRPEWPSHIGDTAKPMSSKRRRRNRRG